MNKKAIIYDLDNTIYSVKAIGEELLGPLFKLIEKSGSFKGDFENIKKDMMRKPFQVVSSNYQFSEELHQEAIDLLKSLSFKGEIKPYADYGEIKQIPGERFLVTLGFSTLQWSKIRKMNLERDFSEIHVVDPSISKKTKKDVFRDIMERKGYASSDLLVVGDDPESEIKAAGELGIETVLFDKGKGKDRFSSNFKVSSFLELAGLMKAP